MSKQVDRVLAVLDVGLQSSGETGYGTDRAPTACSRCQHEEPMEGGDLCGGCRAYLLGDVDDDPVAVRRPMSGIAAAIAAEVYREHPIIERVNHANGLPVIGGIMDGSRIAAEGRHMEVPITRPLRVPLEPDEAPIHLERELYRRQAFTSSVHDRLMWAWVHTSLTGEQAARRLVDYSGS